MESLLEYISKNKSSEYSNNWIESYTGITHTEMTDKLSNSGYKQLGLDEVGNLKLNKKRVTGVKYFVHLENYQDDEFTIYTPGGRKYKIMINHKGGGIRHTYYSDTDYKSYKGLDSNPENLEMVNKDIFV